MSNLNLNKVVLAGRITHNLELKQTTEGVGVCSFSIAVARKYSKDKQQQTDYIQCVAWRNTAEFIAKHFGKGAAICVCGSIQTRSWQDKEGRKQYSTEIIVDEAMFVDSKAEAQPEPQPSQTFVQPNFESVPVDDDLPF